MICPLTGPTPEMLKVFAVAAGWPEPPDNPGADVSRGMTAVFELLARDYDIRHRRAAPQCPRCCSPYPHHRFMMPNPDRPGDITAAGYCTDPWHAADAIAALDRPYTTPGARHCRCTFLGADTPEHDASALCVSLRPDADRDPEPAAGKCWDCTKGRHGLCTGKDDVPPVGTGGSCACTHAEPDADRDPEQAPEVATGCLTCHGDIGLWNPPRLDSGYTHIRAGGGPDWDLNKAHVVVPADWVPFPPEWSAPAPAPFEVEIKGLPVDPEAWCVSCNHPHPAHVFSCEVARNLREQAQP